MNHLKIKILILGFKMEQIEYQDFEWANDWKTIENIFDTIENLKSLFEKLGVTYLREIQQKILILNLEKYTYSLQNYIIEKYSRESILRKPSNILG